MVTRQEFIMKMFHDDFCIKIYYSILYCEQILNVYVQDMLLKYCTTYECMIKMNNMYQNILE